MRSLIAHEATYPVLGISEPCRGSVIHLDDGVTKPVDHRTDYPPHRTQADPWGPDPVIQPEFIPHELTSVSVQQPMSIDDPYSAIDGYSVPSEIIVELADLQPTSGLGIEAYKPRTAKPKPCPVTTVDRQQKVYDSHLGKKSTALPATASSTRPQKQPAPCNTSQALDITDLSTDTLASNSLHVPLKASNASIKLAYFKHKIPAPERTLSASGLEARTTYLDGGFKRSSHFKSSRVVINSKPDISYITMSMPSVRHTTMSRSPRIGSGRKQPLELNVRGRALSYREQITPSRKKKALKEADLLKVTTSCGEPITNPLNSELLDLTHPFSNHPLYRSALYTGDVLNLYVQGHTDRDHPKTQDCDRKRLQRLMRPTVSSAGKVSTYATYLNCTDLIRNLPLESDDYAHPDNNISSHVDYRTDTQLHLGADKAPLPAASISATDRILHEILTEQAEERNAHMRLLSRNEQSRPRSAPLRVATGLTIDSRPRRPRRPRSAMLAFMSEAQTVETTICRRELSLSPELEEKKGTATQHLQEEPLAEVTFNDSFPPLIKRNSFLPTPSPKNHILAVKKSALHKPQRKYNYTGEECSSMDTFPEEVNLQKRLQFKRKLKSVTSLVATLQLSGRPTGREITTPSSARLSRKRQAAMETNSYGSVISPQLPACATHLMQATPSKEVGTSNQKVQKRQVEERIRQLTSPEHLQDRCIADKEGEYTKWGSCRHESPQIAPPQVVLKANQRQAASDPRPWSSSQRRRANNTISDFVPPRSQSANSYRNYEHFIDKCLSGTTPTFVPTTPVLHQPPSPDRFWKHQETIPERDAVIEAKTSIDRRSTVASHTTNFSSLTCLTSKSGSSCQSTTFLQGYSRGRANYFSSHPISGRHHQQGGLISGRGVPPMQVPYGGLVSPHKNCFLAQIDEEERFAYASGHYADPTGLARSVQLTTNLGGRGQK